MPGNEEMTHNNNTLPYLSFIIAARNDDHGGNMLARMQLSISGILEQMEKYKIESEYILVDWNPPSAEPLLKDAIKWPPKSEYCTIRTIVVPHSIHQRYQYSDKVPIHKVISVNCGIRHARGQFILPGSMDLLYSDELMSFIAARSLKKDERYRIDRSDVDRDVVKYNTLPEQLDYCRKNIIRIKGQKPQTQWGIKHGFPHFHTGAAGDFQLMSRDYWHLIRGFHERDIHSAHVDGLLSYMSYAGGVKEVILNEPMRLYHIDHDDKFTTKLKRTMPFEKWLTFPLIPARLNRKLITLYGSIMGSLGVKFKSSVDGVPTLDNVEYMKMCRDILSGKLSYILNDENWGLGQEQLTEFVINTASWDRDYEQS